MVLVSKIIYQNDEEDDNYAKEVLMEQYSSGWGGFTEEVVDICRTVGLGNASEVFLGGLKEEMKAKKKLDRISNADFRKMQSYMLKKSLADLVLSSSGGRACWTAGPGCRPSMGG